MINRLPNFNSTTKLIQYLLKAKCLTEDFSFFSNTYTNLPWFILAFCLEKQN